MPLSAFALRYSFLWKVRILSGVCRPMANHLISFPSKARQKQGDFPPSTLLDFNGNIPLSDFRPSQNLIFLLRSTTPHPGRISHVTQDTFLTCCPHYPGGPEQVDRLRPCSAAAFPEYRAGRHPRLSFRGLLRVHSRYGLPGCCSPCGLHLSPELQQEDLSSPLSG